MFCPECGKPNPEENMFCQFCNALLVDNSVPPVPAAAPEQFPYENFEQYSNGPTVQYTNAPVVQYANEPEYHEEAPSSDVVLSIPKVDTAKIVDFIKKKKFIVFPALALLVAVIAFFSIGSSLTSPERVAKKYFEALTENDFKTMYNYVSAPEGDFVSKDAYLAVMENSYSDNPYINIKNFTIEDYESSYENYDDKDSESFTKTYIIEFVDDYTGYRGSYSVELVKQRKNTLLFFKNYKVALGNMICQNANLTVPSGFTVTIDGITLENGTQDEYGNDVYVIDAIFTGDHKFKLESDFIEPYETDIYIGSDEGYIEFSNYNAFTIKDSLIKSLEDKAASDLKTLYNSAISGIAFSSLNVKATENYEYFADHYDDILRHVNYNYYYEGVGLKSVKFNSYEMDAGYSGKHCSLSENNGLVVSFNLKLNYDFSATKSSWGGTYDDNGTTSDTVQFNYKLVNGEWVLNGLGYYTISY